MGRNRDTRLKVSWKLRRIFRFAFPWRDLAKVAAAIAAMLAAHRLVAVRSDLAWSLAAIVVTACAYVTVFVLLDGLSLRRRLMKLARG